MKAKHTPGPIEIDSCAGGYNLRADSVGKGYFGNIGIAVQRYPHPTYGGEVSDATAKANALLWAAAPKLLAALDDLVRAVSGDTAPGELAYEEIQAARAIMRKARGEK